MILGNQISDTENVTLLFLLIIVGGMLYSGPFVRVGMVETAIEGRNDPTVIYHMLNFYTLFQCVMCGTVYFLIGYFMERGSGAFM